MRTLDASFAAVSPSSDSPSLGEHSMKITDSNLKNSASDLAAQNRKNHFSFERMVKLVPVSQGNPVLKAELIYKTQFESTPYTDSINCVSNLIRKFEQPILNIAEIATRFAFCTQSMEACILGLDSLIVFSPDVKNCDGDLDFNELPGYVGISAVVVYMEKAWIPWEEKGTA
ncbi:hypothetical protein LXL04_039366 [Taraxacum kok-saghyz]